MFAQLAFSLVNGLSTGAAVFLVASGLTLIYGILHVLNFAHGAFFMVGAYVAFSIMSYFGESTLVAYLAGAVGGGLVVMGLGILVDLYLLRRLRDVEDAYSLIATFALLLCMDGAVKLVWGFNYHSTPLPDALAGLIQAGPVLIPVYSLFVILLSVLVFVSLDVTIHRMWIGKLVWAVRHDRWMANVIGLNVPALFTGTVAVAFLLAGLAGGLMLPNQGLSPDLGHSYLLQAFIVVIIGGLGSIRGAFLTSILLGLIQSMEVILLPNTPGLLNYIAIVIFLIWRPHGLLRRSEA